MVFNFIELKGGKNMLKDKKGKTSPIMMVLAIVGIGLLLAVTYGLYNMSVSGGDKTDITTCADSTGILTVNSISAIPGGTAPTGPTITAGIDGGPVATTVTSGTTTFPVGSDLKVLVSDTDSIDRSFDFVMPCGGYTLPGELYYSSSDNPSISIWNDDGNKMSDNVLGGATNQTVLTSGETLVANVEFQGTNTESSGDGVYVVELGSSANITSITLGNLPTVEVPSVHVLQSAGSKAVAFKVPAIVGADKKTYPLSIVLGSGKKLSGGVYTDWYASQEFIDDDLTIKSGVEDSDGTATYENTIDSDFYIDSA